MWHAADFAAWLEARDAEGAWAGLTYAPGMFADEDEMIALCSVLRGTGAFARYAGELALEPPRIALCDAPQAANFTPRRSRV
jgi:hypothetical protein